MNTNQRRHYTAEFKAQILAILKTGKPASEVAKDFEITTSIIYRWRQEAQRRQLGNEGRRAAGEQAEVDELSALRRQVARLQAENEILKKAAIILGTTSSASGRR